MKGGELVSLNDVESFGAIEAESDDLLDDCFEEHVAFKEALSGRRFLVLGRKGSGKTAIYKKLLSLKSPEIFTVGHTFSDYPWQYHDKQIMPSAAEQERYLNSWRYLILLSLAKVLLNFDQSQPWSDDAQEALAKVESFVIDSYGSRDPDITQIFHPGKRLRHLKRLSLGFKGASLGLDVDELAMPDLPLMFQDVNKSLQQLILTSLNPVNKYYVCFDQLDLTFQPTGDEYKQRLIGLILAARDFITAAGSLGCFLKVVIFLRSDIYYKTLLFEDKNKITDTYRIEVEWDQPGRATLKSIMERRFAKLLSIPEKDAWYEVFDEETEMRGRQKKYQHILDRTFRRPRDIIRFSNSILGQYKLRVAQGSGARKFQNEDVNLAHHEYSSYLRDEIIDEIYKYLPDYQIYFEMLRTVGTQIFTSTEFKPAFDMWNAKLKQTRQPEDVLEQLFEFSIIGTYSAGGAGYGGSGYIYKYLDPRAEFNRQAQQFRVHWGLVEAFGLKQYSYSRK
jgi:hypothetical protein